MIPVLCRWGMVLFGIIALGGLAPGPSQAALCLNEIMGDPASDWDGDGAYDYRDDEWVELYNDGTEAIDLGEYGLSDDTGLWTFGFEAGDLLPAGDVRVMYGSQSLLWQQANGHSSYGFSMSNDGDTVLLWQFSDPDTLLVDSHTFNTYEADDDRSTGRTPDGTGDWEIYDALNPYSGSNPPFGNGLAPTPGVPNSGEPPTPAEKRSWGSVKALFR